jgi:hypothetical protein
MFLVLCMAIRLNMAVCVAAPRLWLRVGGCGIQKGRLVRMGSYHSNFVSVSRGEVGVDEDEDVG